MMQRILIGHKSPARLPQEMKVIYCGPSASELQKAGDAVNAKEFPILEMAEIPFLRRFGRSINAPRHVNVRVERRKKAKKDKESKALPKNTSDGPTL